MNPAQAIRPPVRLTEDVEWIDECYVMGDRHVHVSVYLIHTDEGDIIIDTGAFYHRDSIKARLKAATEPRGLGAIILSHADYPHAANVSAFRAEWGDVEIVASSGVPELQGLPYATRSRLGERMTILGREFSFLDPPLADRSHTSWIFDHGSGVLFTADGMGNLHTEGECSLTFGEIPGGVSYDNIHAFHRGALVWLRYVDPGKLHGKLESIFEQFDISYVAPIHGNPIAAADLGTFMERLDRSVAAIAAAYQAPA
jgi:flavorubredoxin